MLALAGFLMVVTIIYLLLKGKSSPITVMIIVPVLAAILLGTNLDSLGEYVGAGMETVMGNAILFIFSIIFFGIMSDLGVFDVLVNRLIKIAGNNIVGITVATGIIAIIAHLDGATATTVLVTIPAMYPVFKKMEIKTEILLCLIASAMGVMNLLPWGGPVARSASVLGMNATDLWLRLIPVQLFGVAVTIGLAIILGMKEKNRLASKNQKDVEKDRTLKWANASNSFASDQPALAAEGVSVNTTSAAAENGSAAYTNIGGSVAADRDDKKSTETNEEPIDNKEKRRNKKLLPFNILWTIFVIGFLVWDQLPSYFVFMLALSVTLLVNYPSLKEQNDLIKKHAGSALMISATMLAAGVMVGVMDGTGMVQAMAGFLTGIIPNVLGNFLHLIFGIIALPMGMVIGTDAYFFGFMPPVLEVGAQFGITPINTAMTMLIGKNLSLLISPLVPATFLALGLVDTDLKSHMKFSMKYLWITSIIMLLFALFMGVIQL